MASKWQARQSPDRRPEDVCAFGQKNGWCALRLRLSNLMASVLASKSF